LRASSIAVDDPATREPTIIASYILNLHTIKKVMRIKLKDKTAVRTDMDRCSENKSYGTAIAMKSTAIFCQLFQSGIDGGEILSAEVGC
jgi:hypothetical protein